MSQQLQDSLNKSNGMYETIKKRLERWQYHQDQIKERAKEKRKGNEPIVYANVNSKNLKEGSDDLNVKKDKKKRKEGDESGNT